MKVKKLVSKFVTFESVQNLAISSKYVELPAIQMLFPFQKPVILKSVSIGSFSYSFNNSGLTRCYGQINLMNSPVTDLENNRPIFSGAGFSTTNISVLNVSDQYPLIFENVKVFGVSFYSVVLARELSTAAATVLINVTCEVLEEMYVDEF